MFYNYFYVHKLIYQILEIKCSQINYMYIFLFHIFLLIYTSKMKKEPIQAMATTMKHITIN